MKHGIDWTAADRAFSGSHFTPEKGRGYEMVLANWRLEQRPSYDEDRGGFVGEPETVLGFDVLRINNVEYDPGAMIWQSTSRRLYDAMKPVLQAAEQKERGRVTVQVNRTEKNEYVVIDLERARGEA